MRPFVLLLIILCTAKKKAEIFCCRLNWLHPLYISTFIATRRKERLRERGREVAVSDEIHGKNRLAVFPSRESLVSDIPVGDGKTAYLF
jgi:hypothetical protein